MAQAMVDQLVLQLTQQQKKYTEFDSNKKRKQEAEKDRKPILESIELVKEECSSKLLPLLEAKDKEKKEQDAKIQVEIERFEKIQQEHKTEVDEFLTTYQTGLNETGAEKIELAQQNQLLKAQAEQVAASMSASETKINEIMSQGAEERRKLLQKGEESVEKSKKIQEEIETMQPSLEEARKLRQEWDEKIKTISEAFQKVQEDIGSISSKLSGSKNDHDQLSRRSVQLENENTKIEKPKLDKIREQHTAETITLEDMEKKYSILEKQVEKLQSLCESMSS